MRTLQRPFHSLFLGALATAALAQGAEALTLQERQQAACSADVQRLCADAVPDVTKVTACMNANRAQVSPPCAKFYGRKGARG
jgi:hypothetical protein